MRSEFYEYYQPTKVELVRAWSPEALIVLDTNVLLDMYRMPVAARKDFIKLLSRIRDRLWLPHHVALEFQRRRISIIQSERKIIENVMGAAKATVSDLIEKVNGLQLEKRGLDMNPKEIIVELEEAALKLADAVKKAHDSQLDVSASDPVRDEIDQLFEGRIGLGPTEQSEMEALIEHGEHRYQCKIPPGFMDSSKEKNPNEAEFSFNGIRVQRKFGDLIIWRQIISKVKEDGTKAVVFVTGDKKDDWWWRESGKTLGPHPDLVRELKSKSGAEVFWMYSSDGFAENANEYLGAKVSARSLEQIKGAAETRGAHAHWQTLSVHESEHPHFPDRAVGHESQFLRAGFAMEPSNVARAVSGWIRNNFPHGRVLKSKFPNFIARVGSTRFGVGFVEYSNLRHALLSESLEEIISQGEDEVLVGRLATFTLLVVISESSSAESENLAALRLRIKQLARRYHVSTIAVGEVLRGDFVMIFCE